jgi:hypothetical protein
MKAEAFHLFIQITLVQLSRKENIKCLQCMGGLRWIAEQYNVTSTREFNHLLAICMTSVALLSVGFENSIQLWNYL